MVTIRYGTYTEHRRFRDPGNRSAEGHALALLRLCRTHRSRRRPLAGKSGLPVADRVCLPNDRRVDVAAIDSRGGIAIVEVKSSVADFRADDKWPCYRAFCDSFYFAVDRAFPLAVLPDGVGVITADGFEGVVVRPSPVRELSGARRRALLLRFGRTAAARLTLIQDPDGGAGERR